MEPRITVLDHTLVRVLVTSVLLVGWSSATGDGDDDGGPDEGPGATYYAVHVTRGAGVGDDDSYIAAGYPRLSPSSSTTARWNTATAVVTSTSGAFRSEICAFAAQPA
jgi:hypothetical protein